MDGFLPNLVKYLLFGTNFLVFVMAIVCLGFAIALGSGKADAIVDLIKELDDEVNITLYAAAAVMLIVVSLLIVVVTFLGCCGAIRENRCMLGVYFAVLMTMFVALIIGAVIGYSKPVDEVKNVLKDGIGEYDPDSTSTKDKAVRDAWDKVQQEFECCGVDSYEDWEQNNPKITGVPESCCKGAEGVGDKEADVQDCMENPENVEPPLEGCYAKIETFVEDNANDILIVAVIVVVTMFLNMIFAFAMCTMTA